MRYIKTIHLSQKKWTNKSILNYFHPSYGPLPTLLGLIEHQKNHFKVALWDSKEAIFIFLEWLSEDKKNLICKYEEYKYRGWIAQTYRWTIKNKKFITRGLEIPILEYPEPYSEKMWKLNQYKILMFQSIRLAMNKKV
jgi:hypothetical protein